MDTNGAAMEDRVLNWAKERAFKPKEENIMFFQTLHINENKVAVMPPQMEEWNILLRMLLPNFERRSWTSW